MRASTTWFETFFSKGLGGVDYGDGQRLVVGGDKNAAYQGMCEVDVMDGADTEAEAQHIARRIAEMVQSGFAVRGKEGVRPCRYDDFCILLRGRKGFPPMRGRCARRASRRLRIPRQTSWTSRTSAPLRRCCGSLTIPRRIFRWRRCCSARCSPIRPMIWWPCAAACPQGSLYGAVLGDAADRFAEFTAALTEYRRLARTLPVAELLEELLARTGYLAAVGALPDGARCREDLLSFTAWASGAGRAGTARHSSALWTPPRPTVD